MPVGSLANAPRVADSGAEGEAANSSAPYGTLRFDFGTDTSTVAPDFIQVSDTMRYFPERGFGWLTEVTAVDRGMADDERRDFVAGQDITFAVDVPNGTYVVELTLGDRRQAADARSRRGVRERQPAGHRDDARW
jgi:fibronectin type 3 domain-containing protein